MFGSVVLLAVLLAASYTFTVSLAAGHSGRLRTLAAARFGAYGTVALIGVAVLVLAYAFLSHDFRLRYVAHYSDRGMPTHFLLTALWGGQDGSLLWWLFLLSLYIGACVYWLGNRYQQLQPYVIATLMTVVAFFAVLMLFAANPFSTSLAGAKADGEGLNPLLQNFYMIIHPPSLYVGFVGCSIPFAFAVAALVTGRLDTEWIRAARKWALFSWLFLAIGNTLGMLWAYEELGWGGYWAWDPVENAAFLPFIVMSAYLHSVMIQERRGMFKVWNVSLICFTFFMTIFGTFLTRSGAIASVHSFAQSGIGTYFAWYMVLLFVVVFSLILYRWPELRGFKPNRSLRLGALAAGWFTMILFGPLLWLLLGRGSFPLVMRVLGFSLGLGLTVFAATELIYRRFTRGQRKRNGEAAVIESVLSREFTFMLNNWALLGFLLFVLVATTFPMISEALWNEKVTVGPPYYNAWVQPLGLMIFVLMGVGTLFGWRKTSESALRRAFFAPTIATIFAMGLHLLIGTRIGFPAIVWGDAIYEGWLGTGLRAFNAACPLLGVAVVVFNLVIITQEFVMLIRARARTGAGSGTPMWMYYAGISPGVIHMLFSLPPASRRRYGGYVVHLGLVVMVLGFTGQSWNKTTETSLSPGQSVTIEDYELTYVGPRMEVDDEKRAIYGDVRVRQNGKDLGLVTPAKFIYKKMPESPTTEVSMLHALRDDLYVVVGNINPQTKTASFQLHVNMLVSWIWFGCLILMFGSVVCMWPEPVPEEARAWRVARGLAGAIGATSLGVLLALMPTQAFALQTSSSHAGTVRIESEQERDVFSGLRCMCGGCERLPLTTCACGEAEDARNKVRGQLRQEMSKAEILESYSKQHGTDALTVPPNTGANKAIYAIPLAGFAGSALGLGLVIRRLRKRDTAKTTTPTPSTGAVAQSELYDARLDEELSDLER